MNNKDKTTNKAGSSSSNQVPSNETPSERALRELRRRGNVESSQKTRERKKQREELAHWIVYDNERKIRDLEKELNSLSKELEGTSLHDNRKEKSNQKQPK